uniref:Uncharacterized protein n=1 Tax=Arundo donax TaxID=35708 RepID=A0A0A9BFN3_ARUDO
MYICRYAASRPVNRSSISGSAAKGGPAPGPCRRECWCWPSGVRSPSTCTPPLPPAAAASGRGGRAAARRAAPPASPAPLALPPRPLARRRARGGT